MALDRAEAQRRDPAELQRLVRGGDALAVVAGADGVLVCDGELVRVGLTPELVGDGILLGLEGERALLAVDLDAVGAAERASLAEQGRVVALREAGVELEHSEAGLAAYLTALLNWHRRHGFCANCGAPTAVAEGGASRRCARCGATHFPRTDPVVIMTVEHDSKLLLGRRSGWPRPRCSVLAGFVSPGESAEEAVVREVREESGILARDPVYVATQPWPFPASLMLGFDALSDGGEPRPRDGELEEVGWFTLDDVRAAVNGSNPELELPSPVSIARYLIERWVAAH